MNFGVEVDQAGWIAEREAFGEWASRFACSGDVIAITTP